LLPEVSLAAADGQLLATSAANPANPSNATLSQFLLPGTYLMRVRGMHDSAGGFQLATQLVPETCSDPFTSL
jgi:hypothetical protein